MSGSCGPWPTSPQANPAKPAPLLSEFFNMRDGNQFCLRRTGQFNEGAENVSNSLFSELRLDFVNRR